MCAEKDQEQDNFTAEEFALLVRAVELIRQWEDSDELAYELAKRLFRLYERTKR